MSLSSVVASVLQSVTAHAQSRNKWRKRIKGQPADTGSPTKWPLKWSVCV